MELKLRLPQINAPTEREQISQIKSYLYQIIPQLEWALNNVLTPSEEKEHTTPQASNGEYADYVVDTGTALVNAYDPTKGRWRFKRWRSGTIDLNAKIKLKPNTEGKITDDIKYTEEITLTLPYSVDSLQFSVFAEEHYLVGVNTRLINNKTIGFRFLKFGDAMFDETNISIVASGKYKK